MQDPAHKTAELKLLVGPPENVGPGSLKYGRSMGRKASLFERMVI
jgi:hypothetical protein